VAEIERLRHATTQSLLTRRDVIVVASVSAIYGLGSPEDYYAGGMLLPAAGHKGYGLALLMEFLAGLLTGSGCAALPGFAPGNGVLFLVLSIEAFRPLEAFLADGAALCERVKAVPPAPGFDEVLLPGEPEHRTAERCRIEGVPIDEVTWAQLAAAAAELEVAVPT